MKRQLILLLFVAAFAVAPLAFTQGTAVGPNLRMGTASLNWAGYAVTGSAGSVTYVAGSWVVPTISCTKQTTYVAFWAGIDGFASNTVEQAGVLAQCSKGSPSYSAWYEFYPSPMVTISSVTVKPGDTVAVSVSYSSGLFTITLTNGTRQYTTSGSVSGAQLSSAECITERPAIGGSLTSLADFGTVSFGNDYTLVSGTCYATVGSTTGSFGSLGAVSITMTNYRGETLAAPSQLTQDGSSFNVTWYASK